MKSSDNDDTAVALLYELTAIVREEIGFNEQFASQIAEAIMRGLRRRMGGDYHYIPAPDRRERAASVRAAFDGRNREYVIREFGISKSSFYRILNHR